MPRKVARLGRRMAREAITISEDRPCCPAGPAQHGDVLLSVGGARRLLPGSAVRNRRSVRAAALRNAVDSCKARWC